MSEPRVILLEFNELTPSLLEGFFEKGLLPNFRKFYDESSVFVTDAEETGKLLNPWVQWVTVHSGLSAAEHGLKSLNEGHLLEQPRVWDLASRAGMRAFVCGSMNVAHDPDLNGIVLPDPWSTTVEPYPKGQGLEDFYRFVQMQVQEHTNDSVPLSKSDYARFLKFMVAHGMSAFTVSSIVKQLTSERVSGGGKWKRAVILDKLQFDVFRSMFKKHRPHFSTFFLNSTAHMQHAYWRHMDPEPFKLKPKEEERDEYGGAVRYGYEEMDRLLGRIMDLAGDDVTVVFSTALGQQPYLTLEDSGGKHFYRPRAFADLTAFLGIESPHKCAPVMSEQFRIIFESEKDADAALPALEGLRIGERQVLEVRRDGPKSIFTGCQLFDEVAEDAVMMSPSGSERPFFDIFYTPHTVKSGMHHPHGALWVRTPSRYHRVHEGTVSLRSVAPTLLELLGLTPPSFMSAAPLEVEPAAVAT
jgi:hypothetical protein